MANVIDISIKNLFKVKNYVIILDKNIIIEEKLDGVKVQLYLKKDASVENKFYDNWIVSYKGNILNYEEFYSDNPADTKGYHQFKFIFDYLEKVDISVLEKGSQFFCEYLIKKPTLMSDYIDLYKLILLSYGKSDCKEKNGMMICNETKFVPVEREERDKVAKIMNFEVPPKIFEGILYPVENFKKGLNSDFVKKIDVEIFKVLKEFENDKETYLKMLTNYLISVESKYGNEVEGYVIIEGNNFYKFQKETQIDKKARLEMKMKSRMNKEDEEKFWLEVTQTAEELFSKLKKEDLRKSLKELSEILKNKEIDIFHSKKTIQNIKDDIYLNVKMKLIEYFSPETGLIMGKFRVLTKKHYKLIENALKENKFVIIALSLSDKLTSAKELRKNMILDCFKKDKNRIEIVFFRKGFIPLIISKSINGIGVTKVYAGTDRVKEYEEQIKGFYKNIDVIELKRDDDISATNTLKNINNIEIFKKFVPECVLKYTDEIKKIYKL